MTILKTENSNTSFKRPPMQISTLQTQNQSPTPISAANVITTSPSTVSNQNDPSKRRGCRCGNATAAPGKLTCCGQRCPCYVDSKACIDCKCKGCRNPHYVDGHKKVSQNDIQTRSETEFCISNRFRCDIMYLMLRRSSSSNKVSSHPFNSKQRW
jgi:CXC domain of E3 ubiquitin-protein ligase MSL2